MKIKLENSFKSLIYSLLIKYWKGGIIFSFCVFVLFLAVVLPHVFTYKLGRNVFIAIALIALYFDFLCHLPLLPEKIKVRFHLFFEKYFLIILLLAISLFSIGALNEKLFSIDPAVHSIYDHITIGGVMPFSDNARYLIDIQSFLKYGVMQLASIYRPLGHLVATILYSLCSENIISYYYFTTAILITAIFWLGKVVARHINKSMALVTSFFLCLYFALFQGSFMTELIGGIVGLFAFTAMLDSIFRKNVCTFLLGIFLFGLGIQIRSGALFALPLLIIFGAIYFRKKYRDFVKILFVSGVLVVLALITPMIQLGIFSQKIDVTSNVGFLVYQIQVNSRYWYQVQQDFPERFNGLNTYDHANVANEIAWQKFQGDPGKFFVNYFLVMYQVIKNPGLYVFHFTQKIPQQLANFSFFLFLMTPVLYNRSSKMHFLFWFLLIGLIGSVLSSPLLEPVRVRAYAASISFNVMIFAVSVANGFIFLKGFQVSESGLHWDFYYKRKIVWLRLKNSIFKIWKRKEIVQTLHDSTFIYIFIALIIIIGPVILDKSRFYDAPQTAPMDSLPVHSEEIFLLSVQDSPHALFDNRNDFVVNNPLIVPRTKLMNNKQFDIWPESRFYLFNALNHFEFKLRKQYSPYLIIPETLLASMKLDDVSMITLKGEIVLIGNKKIFISKEIMKVILKNR
jgi:hypothetical protein